MAKLKNDEIEKIAVGYNNSLLLFAPFELVSVLPIPKGFFTIDYEIYDVKLIVNPASGPEVVSYSVSDMQYKIDTTTQIALWDKDIKAYNDLGKTIPVEAVVLKKVNRVTNVTHQEIKENFLDRLTPGFGSLVVKKCSFKDAVEDLYRLNKDDNALFSLEIFESVLDKKPPLDMGGMFVGNFYLHENIVPIVEPMKAAIESGQSFCFMLTGDSGYGKTSSFAAIAEYIGIPLLYINCPMMLDTTSWFGMMQAKDGNTSFETSDFVDYVQNGNCVIVLDEINRLPIEVLNALFPLLDDRGEITVNNVDIKRGDGVLFGITMNEGIEYTGIAGMLDKAFKSRIMGQTRVGPLPNKVEADILTRLYNITDEQSENIVKIMHIMRNSQNKSREEGNFVTADLSTRTSKIIAWWIEKGLDIITVLDYTIFNKCSADEAKTLLEAVRLAGV